MSDSGMCRIVPNAANAGGKQTNSMTTTTMSQTWFASQIGPIAFEMSVRCLSRRGPGREQIPHAAAEVRAAEQHVRVQRDDDDPGRDLGQR